LDTVNILKPVVRAANAAAAMQPGDYEQDGLRYCGICHTPKQCRVCILGREMTVGCTCACAQERYDRERKERLRREEAERIMRLRSVGIASQTLRDATFAADDGMNPGFMKVLRRYAEQWEEMERQNIGLMLYGEVGTGKSYGAACVANSLIERRIPACMMNLSAVLNTLGDVRSGDRNGCIAALMQYPLLILDDFGMERRTEYAMEQVFHVIDARYRSGKPLIITTNLPLSEMKGQKELELRRIYDRVLEMCQPVRADGVGRRPGRAEAKRKAAQALLKSM